MARYSKAGILLETIRVTNKVYQLAGKVHWETLRLQAVA